MKTIINTAVAAMLSLGLSSYTATEGADAGRLSYTEEGGLDERRSVVRFDFETGNDSDLSATGWERVDLHNSSGSQVIYAVGEGYNHSNGIKIISSEANGLAEVGIKKRIEGLLPNRVYRVTARVKTDGVSSGRGANVGDDSWNSSKPVLGTEEWQTVYSDFISEANGEATIFCRLGFKGGVQGHATGTVWFDDVAIHEVTADDMYIVEGEKVIVYLHPDQVKATPEQMRNWVKGLDKTYSHCAALVGGVLPFHGEKMVVLASDGIESRYWALAGYPILWAASGTGVTRATQQIATGGDWVFGILHEIGHNFNAGENRSGPNSRWNWNDEIFANFRMNYALDMEPESVVLMNDTSYRSSDIQYMYKGAYDKTLGAGIATENGDALHYTFCRIKNKYGWDVFKKAFRELHYLPRDKTQSLRSKHDKFTLFLDVLSKYAGEDVKTTYPAGELDLIKKGFES